MFANNTLPIYANRTYCPSIQSFIERCSLRQAQAKEKFLPGEHFRKARLKKDELMTCNSTTVYYQKKKIKNIIIIIIIIIVLIIIDLIHKISSLLFFLVQIFAYQALFTHAKLKVILS